MQPRGTNSQLSLPLGHRVIAQSFAACWLVSFDLSHSSSLLEITLTRREEKCAVLQFKEPGVL